SSASALRSMSPSRNGVMSAVRQPVNVVVMAQSYLDPSLVHIHGVARHEDVVVGPPVYGEISARQRHDDAPARTTGAGGGDRRGAGAGAAGHRLGGAALPDPHLETIGTRDPDELRVHAAREERVTLEAWAQLRERQRGDVIEEHHAVRIAHRHAGDG